MAYILWVHKCIAEILKKRHRRRLVWIKNKTVGSLISTSRSPICSEKMYTSLVGVVLFGGWSFRHHVCVKTCIEKANTPRWYYRFIFFSPFGRVHFFSHPSLSIEKRDLFYRSAASPVSRPFAKLDLSIYTVGAGRIRRGSGRIIKIYRGEKHIMY